MASKKKGLSADEKKAKMLELFYESKEFFQMKELEKIGPKRKGVISQSVKEAVETLVGEGLVEREKIGSMVCYWAFPSKALNLKKRKLETLDQEAAQLEVKLVETSAELESAKVGREESDERTRILKEVAVLKNEEQLLEKKLAALSRFDENSIEKIREQKESVISEANKWTDNIFTMKKWCKGKFQIAEAVLDKQFEIPEDLDYIS